MKALNCPEVQFRRCHKKGWFRTAIRGQFRKVSGEAGEFGAGSVGQEREDADAGAGGELAAGGGAGVADDGGGLVEATGPARPGDVAKYEAFVFDSGGFEDGAGDLDKVGPAGGDADEAAVECGEPGVEPGAGGVDLKSNEFDAHREQGPDGVGLAGAAEGDGGEDGFRFGAVFERGGGDGKDGELADLGEEDVAYFGVGLDEEEVVWRRKVEPLGDASADVGGGHVEFADGAEESGDVLVEDLLGGGRGSGVVFYVDAAAVAELGPAVAGKLAVSGADGVGVNAEAAGEFAGAGEAVAGAEVSCKYGKGYLRDQLTVDGYLAGRGEPESHGSLGDIVAVN